MLVASSKIDMCVCYTLFRGWFICPINVLPRENRRALAMTHDSLRASSSLVLPGVASSSGNHNVSSSLITRGLIQNRELMHYIFAMLVAVQISGLIGCSTNGTQNMRVGYH